MRIRSVIAMVAVCGLSCWAAACGGSTDATAPNRPAGPVVTSADRRLTRVRTITGPISPKSVVASGRGLVFAQNMMYTHTVTVYRANGELAATIPDSVDLGAFGVTGHPGTVQGAPVEAAFAPDGRHVYVSNYSMYGAGFGPEGTDACTPKSGYSDSFLYRVDVGRLAIDGVAPVGPVPKYVAVTPDGRAVLTTNWCGYDMSVTDAATLREVRRIPIGAYPRGIAVDPSSRSAYVAVMGTRDVAVVDLHTYAVSWIRGVGGSPRHLNIDRQGRFLYVTLNKDGRIAKVDLATRKVVGRVATGKAPRSMDLAPDGRSLYVVNYRSDTVTKVRTADMKKVQTVKTDSHPIGITYEPTASRLWVANYSGSILVLDDK